MKRLWDLPRQTTILAAMTIVSFSAISRAQTGPVRPTRATGARPIRVAGAEEGKPSLASVVDKLDWEAREQGVLLIVSAEDTLPSNQPDAAEEGGESELQKTGLPATNSAGFYNTAAVARHFDRRLIRVGSLTVMAPRTMTVLNYNHLPAPDAYEGMAASTKLRLLESTFSDAQWAQAAGEQGIGAGDLNEAQRELYLSMLPDPMRIGPIEADVAPGVYITRYSALSAEQRDSTRLELTKCLTWAFQNGKGGTVGSGRVPRSRAETGYTHRLDSSRSYNDAKDHLGIDLTTVAPNRAKPSQMPDDWAALDRQISLDTVKTVGQLVTEISRQTGAQLYSDPRYASRTLAIRGSSARAADLLHGLCWALTATWRRLGYSFVLTDDLVGLGARRAWIDEWIKRKALAVQFRDVQVKAALDGKMYPLLSWSASDPFRPDPNLASELDAFAAQRPLPLPESGPIQEYPVLPVSDLPQSVQDQFKSEYQQRLSRAPAFHVDSANAVLGAQIQASYIVPGIGRMEAAELTRSLGDEKLLARRYLPAAPVKLEGESNMPAISVGNSNQALLIAPSTLVECDSVAKEAKRRGFSELWIVAPASDDTDLFAKMVHAATLTGLDVHAVVRLMRAPLDASADAVDHTILGEATTQYVRRCRQAAHEFLAKVTIPTRDGGGSAVFVLPGWTSDAVAAAMEKKGDFRPTSEQERDAITAHVGEIASIPNLKGIVFEDVAPPGFGLAPGDSSDGSFADPRLEMGFGTPMRLACLQKYGFDPIDISPPDNDSEALATNPPFFRDRARPAAQRTEFDNIVPSVSSESLWASWCAIRHNASLAIFSAAVKAVRAKRPELRMMRAHHDDTMTSVPNWYDSVDALVPDGIGSAERNVAKSDAAQPDTLIRKTAKAEPLVSYTTLYLGDSLRAPSRTHAEKLQQLGYVLREGRSWNGITVDLSSSTEVEIDAVLSAFPKIQSSQ